MMEAEMVSETLSFYPQLTRLVAREDFIKQIKLFFIMPVGWIWQGQASGVKA
jgi:hypothetical protein